MQAQKSKGAALKQDGIELNDIEQMMFAFGMDDEDEKSHESDKDPKTTLSNPPVNVASE